ncbi:MAG: hypothetical protein U0R26_10545 [Solirubrobacterales bacterium]
MYFAVDLATEPPSVTLAEPDDFKAFEIRVVDDGGDRGRLKEAIAPLGSLDDEGYAWLRQEDVKRLAGDRAADPAWTESFEGLVGYARSHDWVNARGELRAHTEWP